MPAPSRAVRAGTDLVSVGLWFAGDGLNRTTRMRQFTDHDGQTWLAYTVGASTYGIDVSRLHLPEEYSDGWLAVECGDQKFRIAPVPAGWADMSNDELCALLAQARLAEAGRPAGRRTSEPYKPGESTTHQA